MVIEIMPDDIGCHMACPHCPIRKKETGSQGSMILLAFQKMHELFGRTQYEIDFMTNNFIDIHKMISMFEVPNHATVGVMMKETVDVEILLDTLSTLNNQGFNQIHIGISNRSQDIGPDTNWLPSFTSKLWRAEFEHLRQVVFTISNNTIALSKLRQIRDVARANDEELFNKIHSSVSNSYVLTDSGYQKDMLGEVYHANCTLQHNDRAMYLTHRVIAPISVTEPLVVYKRQTELDTCPQSARFHWNNMVLSFMPIGVRVCHRTTDINNPFLWLSYPDFLAIVSNSNDRWNFCNGIREAILMNLQVDTSVLHPYKELTESVIETFAQLKEELI